jgi:hypothetical protein
MEAAKLGKFHSIFRDSQKIGRLHVSNLQGMKTLRNVTKLLKILSVKTATKYMSIHLAHEYLSKVQISDNQIILSVLNCIRVCVMKACF